MLPHIRLDRIIPSKGDNAHDRVRKMAHDTGTMTMSAAVAVLYVACCTQSQRLLGNTLCALPFGVVYSAGVLPIKRLFLCSKNLYVASIWVAWVFGAAGAFPPEGERQTRAAVLFFLHMWLSNIVMDIKDIDGDRRSGVSTLPAYLGRRRVTYVVAGLAVLLAVAAQIMLAAPLAAGYAVFVMFLFVLDLSDGIHASACVMSSMMFPWAVAAVGRWL